MTASANLRKRGSGWEFEDEATLEDFVWENLQSLFGLCPLKRQYIINDQRCDILALTEGKQLVVLELKNAEDRYIVQQLTRYYAALREEQPFAEQVDYEQPIRLIAVAPSFHRDNFTDRKYCHLDIQFLQFQVVVDGEKFYWQLKDIDSEKVSQFEIPYQESNFDENIPAPPRALLNRLSKCSNEEQQEVLKIRRQFLSFDSRMAETPETGCFTYGKGKKLCAEFRFDSKSNQPVLFLWLPMINERPITGRTRIWTNWQNISHIAYVKEGMGRVKTLEEWKVALGTNDGGKILQRYGYNTLNALVALRIENYIHSLKYCRKGLENIEQLNSLKVMICLALSEWMNKL